MSVSRPISRRESFSTNRATVPIFCAEYELTRLVWAERGDDILSCIEQEKRIKRWRREWKFALIEQGNPDWRDLFDTLV